MMDGIKSWTQFKLTADYDIAFCCLNFWIFYYLNCDFFDYSVLYGLNITYCFTQITCVIICFLLLSFYLAIVQVLRNSLV